MEENMKGMHRNRFIFHNKRDHSPEADVRLTASIDRNRPIADVHSKSNSKSGHSNEPFLGFALFNT